MLRSDRFGKYITLACFYIFLTSCSNSNIALHVTNVELNEKELKLIYEVNNSSGKDIWVCTSMDVINNVDYNVIVNKYRKRIKIQLTNREIPSGMRLEEPVYAKYVKLGSNNNLNGVLKISLPINENVYSINQANNSFSKVDYFHDLILEIAIYDKKILFKSECCREDSNDEIAYVNGFWAMKHKANTIQYRLTPVKVPVLVQ